MAEWMRGDMAQWVVGLALWVGGSGPEGGGLAQWVGGGSGPVGGGKLYSKVWMDAHMNDTGF